MEGNGLSGRMYSNAASVGMLGLDIPLHHSNQPQNPQIQLQKHPQQMMSSSQQHHLQQLQQHEQQQTQLSMKQPSNYNISYTNPNSNLNPNPNPNPNLKTKSPVPHSDDDEASGQNDNENATIDGKRKGCGGSSSSSISPWQRMKWTDNMVRLLIMAVYYIGDEAGNEVGPEKKKLGPGGPTCGGGGLLQKKGKWKSVSRAMMEKGFYVSPQQCEDKFNDLNKRYKRVNDILGRGTACKVVENQALLETMELSPKMREEVRKLLNSKHLFFREMCAYHNSCGHGAAGATQTATDGTQNAAVCETDVQHAPHSMPHQLQHQQQPCSHSSAIAPPSMEHNGMHKLEHEDEDDEDDFEDEGDEEDEDEDEEDEDEHDNEGGRPRKRARTDGRMEAFSQALQQFNGEIVGVLQDESKNPWQKKIWMKTQLLQLEEQGLNFETEALELEKQRLKWVRFSSKKEREMDKLKLENHRKRIETKRMVLMLRQKENELIGEPNPSSVTS